MRHKTIPFIMIMCLILCVVAQAQDDSSYVLVEVGSVLDSLHDKIDDIAWVTVVSRYDSLSDAITSIGTDTTTLIIDQLVTWGKNDTIPKNISLQFVNSGAINFTDDSCFILGKIMASDNKIFYGETPIILYNVINPIWFGADRSGTNPSTDALQASFDCLPLSGGHVHVPRGIYTIDDTVQTTKPSIILTGERSNYYVQYVDVEFQGGTNFIVIDNDAVAFRFWSDVVGISYKNFDGPILRDFTIVSEFTATTSGKGGIEISDKSHTRLENIMISSFREGFGLRIVADNYQSLVGTITNCLFYDNFDQVIAVGSTNGWVITGGRMAIRNNISSSTNFTTNPSNMITAGHSWKINNVYFDHSPNVADGSWTILAEGNGVHIQGNTFESGKNGVKFEGDWGIWTADNNGAAVDTTLYITGDKGHFVYLRSTNTDIIDVGDSNYVQIIAGDGKFGWNANIPPEEIFNFGDKMRIDSTLRIGETFSVYNPNGEWGGASDSYMIDYPLQDGANPDTIFVSTNAGGKVGYGTHKMHFRANEFLFKTGTGATFYADGGTNFSTALQLLANNRMLLFDAPNAGGTFRKYIAMNSSPNIMTTGGMVAGNAYLWVSDTTTGVTTTDGIAEWTMGNGNDKIFIMTNTINTTATVDPDALDTGEYWISGDITVTGAELGDYVYAAAPYDLQGMIVTAYVLSTNTVKIICENSGTIDATALDLASGTWNIKVRKPTGN